VLCTTWPCHAACLVSWWSMNCSQAPCCELFASALLGAFLHAGPATGTAALAPNNRTRLENHVHDLLRPPGSLPEENPFVKLGQFGLSRHGTSIRVEMNLFSKQAHPARFFTIES